MRPLINIVILRGVPVALIGLVSFLALTSLTPVGADEGNIRVLEAKAESQFPDGIKFTVTAKSSGQINDIRVFFQKVDQVGRSAYRSFDFEPGETVTGESLLPASGGGDYFPPGTKIMFSFEVRDKAGAVLRTGEQEFVYEDSRFEWKTVTEGLITVYYYGEYVEERARTVLDAAKQNLERMIPVLGIRPTEPLRIVSYNNYRHMSSALPFRSQAVRENLQTQGMAFSDERVLLVHGFDPTVTGTTSHEFTHLLVAEAAGGTSAQVPAWLNEGLAEYGNIDPTDDYDGALRYGIFTRRIKPLWYQRSFGGTPEDIIIAYGQGRSVVAFMIDEFGKEKMAELFRTLQVTLNIDQALLEVYGMDQHGLDSAWRLNLGLEALPSPAELESQLKAEEEAAAASPPDAAEEAPPEDKAPVAPDVAPTSEPEAGPPASTEDGGSSGGCSAPVHGGSGRMSFSLGMLALLGTPAALAFLPALRRRWPCS